MRGSLLLLAVSLLLAACGGTGAEQAKTAAEDTTRRQGFRNANTEVDFVGDAACFDCHEEQYRGYQEHGMAQSYHAVTPDRVGAGFANAERYHAASDLHYRLFQKDGRFFQEEYRLDATGDTTHRLAREMTAVVGNGTAARTYLTERNGRRYELPLTWYAQEQTWDFSPGYRQSNQRFNRLVPNRCMACHNSYPETVPFAEGKYNDVPQGIGCERCHGPGNLHVEARLAAPEPAGDVDSTIVNPAHLPLDRRLDVCQQCHLHTTVSVLREGRGPFDFRPSEPLAAHVSLFAEATPEDADQINVISHADRMKQSACFIGMRGTPQAMDCVTCHDPHEGFRDQGPAYFNTTCKDCHQPDQLQQMLPSEEARQKHTASANCISCHMPKVKAEDAPHASFTDHKIRVVEDIPETEPLAAHEADQLEAYFERDRRGPGGKRYEGIAYVVYGRQQGDRGALEEGIRLLEEALAADPEHGEAQYLLGFARMQLGQTEQALPALEAAVRQDSGIPERLNTLAQAYEATGHDPTTRITRLYQQALSIQPALADVRVNYGRFLETQGRLGEALTQYQRAAKEQPWLATAHFNLGTAYLQRGAVREGADALEQAVALRPDYPEALGNLGGVYAQHGFPDTARTYFERAVEAAPKKAEALGNLGAFYLNQGARQKATDLLERAVQADPQYVDGLVNLALAYAQSGRAGRARRYAQRALKVDPGNARARKILDAF